MATPGPSSDRCSYTASNMPWGYWGGIVVGAVFGAVFAAAPLLSGRIPWALAALVILSLSGSSVAYGWILGYQVTLDDGLIHWRSVFAHREVSVGEVRTLSARRSNVIVIETDERRLRLLVRPHLDPAVDDDDARLFGNWVQALCEANPDIAVDVEGSGRWEGALGRPGAMTGNDDGMSAPADGQEEGA